MINENFLYPFSELDATAKEKAKILVENQPFYLAYLAQKLDHAFIEPFIEASLTPNFDDFFEYSPKEMLDSIMSILRQNEKRM